MPEVKEINNYDAEPWYYCATCLSPSIRHEDGLDLDCCADCGSTDIVESTLEEWEKKYESKYGHKFTQKEEDPKKTFIFKLSVEELKTRLYNYDKWREIIRSVYPNFPGGYSKIDSILLFFDKVIKQNKLDDLKLQLFKRFKY